MRLGSDLMKYYVVYAWNEYESDMAKPSILLQGAALGSAIIEMKKFNLNEMEKTIEEIVNDDMKRNGMCDYSVTGRVVIISFSKLPRR